MECGGTGMTPIRYEQTEGGDVSGYGGVPPFAMRQVYWHVTMDFGAVTSARNYNIQCLNQKGTLVNQCHQ